MTTAEKLALCRRSYAAFSQGPNLDALLPLYHPECEWRLGSMGAALGTDAFRGHDGLRALVAALQDGMEVFEVEIDEARVTDEGDLVLRGHSRARFRAPDMELSSPPFWQQGAFRDGLILSVVQMDEPPSGWEEATVLDLGLPEGDRP